MNEDTGRNRCLMGPLRNFRNGIEDHIPARVTDVYALKQARGQQSIHIRQLGLCRGQHHYIPKMHVADRQGKPVSIDRGPVA